MPRLESPIERLRATLVRFIDARPCTSAEPYGRNASNLRRFAAFQCARGKLNGSPEALLDAVLPSSPVRRSGSSQMRILGSSAPSRAVIAGSGCCPYPHRDTMGPSRVVVHTTLLG
ncbi:hypothetical protein C8Q76DRAFT_178097 [Earliella scabrosa]|nr:hypothetical protein C8Q76DRAFT_178097 [Earliella scabrosa]